MKLGVARVDMVDTYTTLLYTMPLILEFSQALEMIHFTSRDELFCHGERRGIYASWI